MKFSIGDRVILKKTGEEGHVTAVINAEMLEVDVHGITFPVYADDVDHPYLKWFTEKKAPAKLKQVPEQLPVEKEKFRTPRLAKGVYLSFLPVYKIDEMEDVVDTLKIYLLNEMPQSVLFSYEMRVQHKSEFAHRATLQPFTHIYLHTIPYADMNSQPRFHWSLEDANNTALQKAEDVLRIRPAKLFEHINELLKNNEPTFSYLLVDGFAPKPVNKPTKPERFIPELKPQLVNKTSYSSFAEIPRYEIDLHIEQLVDDHKSLSNTEMLDIQIKTLERYVHLAIIHRQERMVVIHGMGKGTLRTEVHNYLQQVPEVDKYTNEWQGQYGFGATEIYFKY